MPGSGTGNTSRVQPCRMRQCQRQQQHQWRQRRAGQGGAAPRSPHRSPGRGAPCWRPGGCGPGCGRGSAENSGGRWVGGWVAGRQTGVLGPTQGPHMHQPHPGYRRTPKRRSARAPASRGPCSGGWAVRGSLRPPGAARPHLLVRLPALRHVVQPHIRLEQVHQLVSLEAAALGALRGWVGGVGWGACVWTGVRVCVGEWGWVAGQRVCRVWQA